MIENILLGLATAFTATNLLFCFVGVLLGTVLGVIPGIGTIVAISLLFPYTFYLPPDAGIIMLAGIYYGTAYGGSISSILLGLPGTAVNAVICTDGLAMTRSGRAGVALLLTAVGSFVGGSFGILLMMAIGPMIAAAGSQFAAPEYFSLMLLGLVAASAMVRGQALKSFIMVGLGILVGMIGTDTNSGIPRLTFGHLELFEGIGLVTVAMALFGIAEIISSISSQTGNYAPVQTKITFASMIPTRQDWKRSWGAMGRGSLIGSFFGTLPGTGGLIASFMSYLAERSVTKYPEEFGKGAVEGVVGPETANNAADQTAFIPTMSLGIPGSASMAIILGVLIMHGLTPGPKLITDHPDLFWGLIMSFWIGNILLLVLNVPMVGLWVRLVTVPYRIIFPAVIMFCCMGVYAVSGDVFHCWLVILIALFGYAARILELPAAPFILGFVLGPMMEENFRRSLLTSRGNLAVFFERPVSGAIMIVTILLIAYAVASPVLQTIRARATLDKAA